VKRPAVPAQTGVTRRRFLGSLGAAGAGFLLAPSAAAARPVGRDRLPAVVDPLYRQPIADPNAIPRFVQPLLVPAQHGLRMNATAGGNHRLVMAQTIQDVLGVGLPTPVWGYGRTAAAASYPGPTVVAHRGRPINLEWSNSLPRQHLGPVDTTLHWAFSHNDLSIAEAGVPAVAHLHGGHVEAASDGGPEQWFTARGDTGAAFVSTTSRYDNSQEAATLWYHDHTLGITRLNVYAGLAGFYLLRDDHETELMESGGLPAEQHEVELVIQDRTFYPDGRLAYPDLSSPLPGRRAGPSQFVDFYGEVILVNGRAWPHLRVEPRPYRFRVLNGSDSRVYALAITPPAGPAATMVAIGTDAGFLEHPVALGEPLLLSPGERADIVVDFSNFAGRTLTMRNLAAAPFPLGLPPSPATADVLQLRVDLPLDRTAPPISFPPRLRSGPFAVPGPAVVTRRLTLGERLDEYGRIQNLLGTTELGHLTYRDPVTETPRLGEVEVWEFYNDMEVAHPMHLHQVAFEVLDRAPFTAVSDPVTGALHNIQIGPGRPALPQEQGPKDTVLAYPGEVTRIRVRFDRPGDYVWHCHNLPHEDNEMMRPLRVR
jgi:spore coat protein A